MKRKLKDVINLKRLLTGEKYTWKIRSLQDLLEFAELVNRQGESFDGWVIKLECNIDLSEILWEPIGNSISNPFNGEFDGKGHTIQGLNIETEAHLNGLFGALQGPDPFGMAEVRNLYLQDVNLSGKTDTSWTGGIAGYAGNGSLIENCHVIGNIRSWSFVGGIIGVAEGSVGIRECSVEGMVIGENLTDSISRNNSAGAIAGKYTTDSILRSCHNKVLRKNGTPLVDLVGKFDDTPLSLITQNETDQKTVN